MNRYLPTTAVAAVVLAGSGVLGVPVATAGGGCGRSTVTVESVTQVGTSGACWSPIVAHVRPGTTVTFANDTDLLHDVSGPGLIGHHNLGPGARVQIAFPSAGVFPYACSLHPAMAGAVVVGTPLAPAAPATAAAPASPAAVSLSVDDDADAGLLGATPLVAGAAAATAGVLGAAGLVAVRRKRTALPTS